MLKEENRKPGLPVYFIDNLYVYEGIIVEFKEGNPRISIPNYAKIRAITGAELICFEENLFSSKMEAIANVEKRISEAELEYEEQIGDSQDVLLAFPLTHDVKSDPASRLAYIKKVGEIYGIDIQK